MNTMILTELLTKRYHTARGMAYNLGVVSPPGGKRAVSLAGIKIAYTKDGIGMCELQ